MIIFEITNMLEALNHTTILENIFKNFLNTFKYVSLYFKNLVNVTTDNTKVWQARPVVLLKEYT